MIRHPLGLARGEVRVAPSDSRWPHLFQLAAEELCTALGNFRGAIEHIGSTAVPGLDAKPIIDLMASVTSLELPDSFFASMAGIGCEHRCTDTVPGRLYFMKGPESARTHSVAICEKDSPYGFLRISFRDRLRADPRPAQDYRALKHRLAAEFPQDPGTGA